MDARKNVPSSAPGRKDLQILQKEKETPITNWSTKPLWLRLGFAFLCVGLGAAFRLGFLAPLGDHAVFVTFYPAVTIAALFGGFYPGLLAGILSAAIATYWLGTPGSSFPAMEYADWLASGVFLASCAMISGAGEAVRRAQARADNAEAQARFAEELKRHSDLLEESEARYRAIGESIDYGVWVCDPAGRNIYASESFLKLVGLTQESCSDFGWGKVLHPDDVEKTLEAWKECVRTGGTWDIEHRFKGVDGQWHPVLARGVPVRDEQGNIKCWVGINLDISKLKHAQEELNIAKSHLEQRVQERTAELTFAVDQLKSEVQQRKNAERALLARSDQLRALASELTFAEQRERQRIAEVLHDGLQQILVAAKFQLALIDGSEETLKAKAEVADLIKDAIAASRSLSAELSPPVLHQGGLIPAIEWLNRWMLEKHGLAVNLTFAEKIEPVAPGSMVLLFQATRELLFNVTKHAKVKSARVEITQTQERVQIAVSDQGIGFEPHRLETSGETSGARGLIGIRERLGLLGGGITIESEPGKGSRISIFSPFPNADDSNRTSTSDSDTFFYEDMPRPEHKTESSPGKKIRVLLVDDHPVMRQGLARLLQASRDIEVAGEASDGYSAIRIALKVRPDVALMDVNMPEMDGIQATRIIHGLAPDVRIIGLSMFEAGDQARIMKEAGAVAYLSKSEPAHAIIAAIRACVGSSDKGESS